MASPTQAHDGGNAVDCGFLLTGICWTAEFKRGESNTSCGCVAGAVGLKFNCGTAGTQSELGTFFASIPGVNGQPGSVRLSIGGSWLRSGICGRLILIRENGRAALMYTPGTCSNGSIAGGGIVTTAGLGCADCGNTCGMSGLTFDGSGLFGSGIFGNGVSLNDFSTWGAGEIAALAIGAWVLYSVAFTTRHTARRARTRATKIKRGFTA